MLQLNGHEHRIKNCAQLMHESATVAFWRPDGADYHIERIIDEYDNMRESIEYLREYLKNSKE